MKKLAKSCIHKFGTHNYCDIIKFRGTYAAVDKEGQIIAYGKELKGYLGDIIMVMYTGEQFGTGDFILESDRHGMICKFKD